MKLQHRSAGFTLVEVLVAGGIVVVLMAVLLGMTDQTQKLVKATSAKVEQFQDARVAFESMTRRLSQATLNTFWDYVYDTNGNPTGYARASDLRFRSGPMRTLTGITTTGDTTWVGHGVFFQAPLGIVSDTKTLGNLDHLLNTWGYFVEVASDKNQYPTFLTQGNIITPRQRYRLMEFMEPSEKLNIFTSPVQSNPNNRNWFLQSILPSNPTRPVRVVAENVVALIILPRLSLADEKRINPTAPPLSVKTQLLAQQYGYDSTKDGSFNPSAAENQLTNNPLLHSKNQLPPVVQVIMVAIDENSARRLEDRFGDDPYLGISTSPDPLSGATLFTDPTALNDKGNGAVPGDLTKLQNLLSSTEKSTNIRASYRVFSTNVTIKGSKWSLHTAQ